MNYIAAFLLGILNYALIDNVVLSRFLGLCPFLGVSRKTSTAAGMGMAVIAVIAVSSAVSTRSISSSIWTILAHS